MNGYFEVVQDEGCMWLKVHLPEDDGEMFDVDEVMRYLDAISFPEFDKVALDQYMKNEGFGLPHKLLNEEILPERERVIVSVTPNGERALARFYPPTTGGSLMETVDDVVSDLRMAGIRHGIKKKAIEHFLAHHEYCRDYIIAEATMPIHGHDAKIRYFFDVNATAKPKLNEDGSVDFHQLGNIKTVNKGDKLASLKPADRGRTGISVLGKTMAARKVKQLHLRYGRNIKISEDKCHIYSDVSGHVTLVDDMVMVSNIYEVPANVDSSTGDIIYKGTVHVTGNVNTGFKIEADGDIVVNGVVEGATLISGGNIVLKRGMQGMDKGVLKAAGNITAKFLENCKVSCKGMLRADAILHSEVECVEGVEVLGRKGLINGGSLRTYGTVHATTLGSTMGAKTEIEVYSDKEMIIEVNSLKEEISDIEKNIEKMDKVAENVKKMVSMGQEVMPEQMEYIKGAVVNKPKLAKKLRTLRDRKEILLERIEMNKKSCIKVDNSVYSGVTVIVKEATKRIKEKQAKCRFVREGADVRTEGA